MDAATGLVLFEHEPNTENYPATRRIFYNRVRVFVWLRIFHVMKYCVKFLESYADTYCEQ